MTKVSLDALLQRCVQAAHGISLLALTVMALVTIADVVGRFRVG